MKAEFDRLKRKGYTEEAFQKYITSPNIKKLFTSEQITELNNLWYNQTTVKVEKPKEVVKEKYSEMNKDQLDEYALNTWGIDLDKRFKKEKMVEELKTELKKQNKE